VVGVVFGDDWRIVSPGTDVLDKSRQSPMRAPQQGNGRPRERCATVQRITEDFFHPLRHVRQRWEVHHRG
jgi:hypothetical protein